MGQWLALSIFTLLINYQTRYEQIRDFLNLPFTFILPPLNPTDNHEPHLHTTTAIGTKNVVKPKPEKIFIAVYSK